MACCPCYAINNVFCYSWYQTVLDVYPEEKTRKKIPQKTAKPFDTSDKVLDELCVAKGDCYEETYTWSGLGVNGGLRF